MSFRNCTDHQPMKQGCQKNVRLGIGREPKRNIEQRLEIQYSHTGLERQDDRMFLSG